MRDSAATGGRRVGHDGDGRALEKIGQSIFVDVPGELDFRICRILFLHRLHVTRGMGMISSGDD